MTEKRLTVILYGCDRNLWRGGPLKHPRFRRVRGRRSERLSTRGRPTNRRSNFGSRCPLMPDRCTASRFRRLDIGRRGS